MAKVYLIESLYVFYGDDSILIVVKNIREIVRKLLNLEVRQEYFALWNLICVVFFVWSSHPRGWNKRAKFNSYFSKSQFSISIYNRL